MGMLFIKNTVAECLLCFLKGNVGTELSEFLLHFFFTLYSLKQFFTSFHVGLIFPLPATKKKKCSSWLLSYNSKTLTFLIALVLLAGVLGRGQSLALCGHG